jgi:hypothetical protein
MMEPQGVQRLQAPLAQRVIATLAVSAKARRSALGLIAMLAYLLLGMAIAPDAMRLWWYQLIQTGATLAVVLVLETVFAAEGGIAWQTHAIALVTTYADVLGTEHDLYHSIHSYDKFIHFGSGAAFAAATYDVLRLLDRRGTIAVSPRRRIVLAFCVSFAVAGVAWEIYEQVSDTMFHSGRVQGRWDTIHDLVSDACGAVAAVAVLRAREVARRNVSRRVAA